MNVIPELGRYHVPHHTLPTPEPGVFTYRLEVDGGPSLYAYAHLHPASVLRVHLHGAIRPADTYPRFDRITTAGATGDAFVSFADPIHSLDREVLLGWFLGGNGWDPNDALARFVSDAAQACGADTVALIGGSGGGFAALRLGLALPRALVYCFNPQIVLPNYSAQVVGKYVETGFGTDRVPAEVMADDPARFDMSLAYAQAERLPTVYYVQNLSDIGHVGRHYVPFKRALGLRHDVAGVSPDGRVRLELVDMEHDGHHAPTVTEFRAQLDAALAWSAAVRSAG